MGTRDNSDMFQDLLETSASMHRHLCPRQVLGVRMGLFGGELLGIAVPQEKKGLFTIVEADGCFSDGISVATNCWVGRRTLRVKDYGKVAVTFVDRETGQAMRIAPRLEARNLAHAYAPEARNRWEAMLLGYQRMPVEELLSTHSVKLNFDLKKYISHAGVKVICEMCGEEIINEREVISDGLILCMPCAGDSYYQSAELAQSVAISLSIELAHTRS